MNVIKNTTAELRDLIDKLNYYTALYDEGNPAISDEEWDKMYFELEILEKETGIYFPDSPTHTISYNVVNSLEKVEHNHKMLSLAKTKSVADVQNFIDKQDVIATCKMDGLTCSLRYMNGELVSAETRGNGIIGENVFHNAQVIPSIPKQISYKQELIIDGEIICTYKDFEQFSTEYKNPRNFASGSIRLLDSAECAKRKLTFIAWDVIKGFDNIKSYWNRLIEVSKLNFTIVPLEPVSNDVWEIELRIDKLKDYAKDCGYPIDGVVFKYDNIEYGRSLGETAHHARNAIAYKFYDEEYETKLIDIDWSMGRTGIITPIAIFQPVDIDGSVVERASLHNLAIMSEILGVPYFDQPIWVCKKNMIIPQIVRAEKELPITYAEREGVRLAEYHPPTFEAPAYCPICGKPTAVNDSAQLYCTNPDCEGKWLNKITHFVSKKGLDIKGLSKTTLEKLIDKGWVNSFADIFLLEFHADEWRQMPGFGEKSVQNILNAISTAKQTTLSSFLSAIGIPLVGRTIAQEIENNGITTYAEFRDRVDQNFNFMTFNGFGPEITSAILHYDYSMADEVVDFLSFSFVDKSKTEPTESKLSGMSFVVTGGLKNFKNREEIKEFIEKNGGKMATAISAKTTALINNDMNSTSSKNLKAKKLNIPIYSEDEFISIYSLIL